jgi:hypothetical protein
MSKEVTVNKPQLPTLAELIQDTELSIKQNQLTVLLNQQPHETWLKPHPTATTKDLQGKIVPAKYLPIDKVEYLLTKIFPKWWVEVIDTSIMANSCCVTVRLFVQDPLTNEIRHNDGVGAKSIQTDKGKGAMDWNFAKDAGVMMALPSAKTYAIKDAAEGFGKIFGRDLNRIGLVSYDNLLKSTISVDDVVELYELKKDSLTSEEITNAKRIINNKEVANYSKLMNILKSK